MARNALQIFQKIHRYKEYVQQNTMSFNKPKVICKEFALRSAEFFQSRQFSDCSFLVGSSSDHKRITAHKLILAVTSPVFEAMLYGNLAEESHQVPVPDMNPEDFKEVLNYIYTNKVNLESIDQAIGVYYGAKKYMLPHLQELCSNYLEVNLEPSNVLRVFESTRLFEDIKLINKATKIFTDSTKLVLSDPSFERINISTLVYIFSLYKLSIDNEMDLFKAALQYKEAQGNIVDLELDTDNEQGDKLTINSAVEQIRFLTLTPKEFAEGPIKSDLLSESEEYSIILNLSSTITPVPYPSRLSKNKQCRNNIVTITCKLKDIKNLNELREYVSTPVHKHNSPWKLMVKFEGENSEKFVSFFIVSNAASETEGWSCKVKGELRICSQKWGIDNVCKVIDHTFTKIERGWGFPKFIKWDKLIDPDQGYIKNNTIILEADIDAEIPLYIIE